MCPHPRCTSSVSTPQVHQQCVLTCYPQPAVCPHHTHTHTHTHTHMHTHTPSLPLPPPFTYQVSKSLREYSLTYSDKRQLFIKAFAKSLEVIPRQLCNNAGFDATDVLNKLRQKHAVPDGSGKVRGVWSPGSWGLGPGVSEGTRCLMGRVRGLPGYRGTGVQGYRGTGVQGYRGTGSAAYALSSVPPRNNPCNAFIV